MSKFLGSAVYTLTTGKLQFLYRFDLDKGYGQYHWANKPDLALLFDQQDDAIKAADNYSKTASVCEIFCEDNGAYNVEFPEDVENILSP